MNGRVDCTCKRAQHQHGTRTAYVVDKCRCPDCTEASRATEAARRRAKAYGRYDSGRVDAQPVREHIQRLGAYGIGLKRLATLAGVSNATLGKIIYGDPSRNMPPRERVEKRVADRVLAVKPRLEYLGRTVSVDGTGTRRRIQALVAIGWSLSRLGVRLGFHPTNFCRVVQSDMVHAETARGVKRLYDELWNQPQTGTDWRSRISANRAKGHAAANGWVPPLAWDDDTIDDPEAIPDTSEEVRLRAKERIGDVEFLLDTGCGLAEVFQRSGYSKNSLPDVLRRHGRADLLVRIQNIASIERAS